MKRLWSINQLRPLAIMEYLEYVINVMSLIGNIYAKAPTTFNGPCFGQTQVVSILQKTIQGDILSPYLCLVLSQPSTMLAKKM